MELHNGVNYVLVFSLDVHRIEKTESKFTKSVRYILNHEHVFVT
jgi:hypothetical protein